MAATGSTGQVALEYDVDDFAKRHGDPIQKNFGRLVNDCDPAKLADFLFQEGALNDECLEKIGKTEKNESRKAAARILFRGLVNQAHKERTFRVVNALISALREEDTAGGNEIADLIAASRREAELAIVALRSQPMASPQGANTRGVSLQIQSNYEPRGCDHIDGPGCSDGASEDTDKPEKYSYRLTSHTAANQSDTWRLKDVSQKHILTIAEELADSWLKIAYELPNMNKQEKPAFGLHDARLQKLKRESGSNEERLIQVLDMWQMMSVHHNCGALYDVLCCLQLKRVAHNVLRPNVG